MNDEILLKTYEIDNKSYYVILETDYNNSHYYVLSNENDDHDVLVARLVDNYIVPLEDQSILKELMGSILEK